MPVIEAAQQSCIYYFDGFPWQRPPQHHPDCSRLTKSYGIEATHVHMQPDFGETVVVGFSPLGAEEEFEVGESNHINSPGN